MSFMDNFRRDREEGQQTEEAFLAKRGEALAAVSALLEEVGAVFGKHPEAEGIDLQSTDFRLQDRSGYYQAPGLRITFPVAKTLEIRPEGLVFGGFSVALEFQGCVKDGVYYLLYPEGEGREGRRWRFRAPVVEVHRPKPWSRAILEELLDYHILGHAATGGGPGSSTGGQADGGGEAP